MIPRYETPEMKEIWSDKTKYRLWIDIEITALKHMIELDVIPLPKISAKMAFKKTEKLDMTQFVRKCLQIEQQTHHDVVAFINVLEGILGDKIGRFIHYGMTSSDLCDTQYAIQMRRSLSVISADLNFLRQIIHTTADQYRNTIMIGRTHGRHAEPLTFGLVLLIYVDEIQRHLDRIEEIWPRVAVGKLSGAVGTYSHIKPQVEKKVMADLGLKAPRISNQIVQRDRHAELFNLLALIGATLEKLAVQIRHLSRDEIAEVFEPFGKKQKGSSAMPHKRNPIKSENVCGMARMLRGYATAALENVALWHERDISHSSVERVAGPDAFNLLHFMILRMVKIMQGLQVDTTTMEDRAYNSPWGSQTKMLALIKGGMSRKEAHDEIQKLGRINQIYEPKAYKKHLRWVNQIFKRIKP